MSEHFCSISEHMVMKQFEAVEQVGIPDLVCSHDKLSVHKSLMESYLASTKTSECGENMKERRRVMSV
eukprot:756487-Hanusia_phi.AAC.2